jgi:cytochrome b561
MQKFRYAKPQVVVHWFAATAIAFLLLTGTLVLESMPNTMGKIGNLRIHMILGGLIAIHVAAVLYHQLIVKDGLLSRMRFGGQ